MGIFKTFTFRPPPLWQATDKTVILLHGLAGRYDSPSLVRLSKVLYEAHHRIVRVSMRGASSDAKPAKRPYHGGLTGDILTVLKQLKKKMPFSPLILIGFSMGGNLALKLLAELGIHSLLDLTIAICPPIDLASASSLISERGNRFYNRYYVKELQKQSQAWTLGRTFNTIYEYDSIVTAPQWGFRDAEDYYRQSSSLPVLSQIRRPCFLIFSEDDPFIDYNLITRASLSPQVEIWLSKKGGHMGFLGWTQDYRSIFWLNELLLKWVNL